MIITTTDTMGGKNYEIVGLVCGNMVQSKNIGKDIGAGFKTIIGGELKGYTDMMSESREEATRRMVAQAKSLGADAIISMRYSASSIMQGAAEVMAYGTAVKFI